VFFGTPRGVYISVGEIPTRQLTIRAVANEIVYFARVRNTVKFACEFSGSE